VLTCTLPVLVCMWTFPSPAADTRGFPGDTRVPYDTGVSVVIVGPLRVTYSGTARGRESHGAVVECRHGASKVRKGTRVLANGGFRGAGEKVC